MNKLKEILKDAGIKQAEICELLDIKSLSTINLKINGKSQFTTKEAEKVKIYINKKTKSNYTLEDLFL